MLPNVISLLGNLVDYAGCGVSLVCAQCHNEAVRLSPPVTRERCVFLLAFGQFNPGGHLMGLALAEY